MHRLVICFAGLIVLLKAEDIEECFKILRFNAKCCIFKPMNEKQEIAKECFETLKIGPHHHSCEFETCYGEKLGIISSDGEVNKANVETILNADYVNNTNILEIVKEKCVNGDLSYYGPPEKLCNVGKLAHCIRVQTVFNCPSWNDTERCNEVKDKIERCQNLFP